MYHEKQKQYSWFDSKPNGTLLGQKVSALASVGVYVPGGKAVYPSSVLMNVMPERLPVLKILSTTPCNEMVKYMHDSGCWQNEPVLPRYIKQAERRLSLPLPTEQRVFRR